MLGLTFVNKDDYEKFQEDDLIDVVGLTEFAPNKNLQVVLKHADGGKDTFEVAHSYNQQQIEWFKAGAALNIIRRNVGA
jgi:aconitate hydratase